MPQRICSIPQLDAHVLRLQIGFQSLVGEFAAQAAFLHAAERALRRGGDGSDLRWYKGPERCATHVMGAFSDGERVFVDMDMAQKNQFPFFPPLPLSPGRDCVGRADSPRTP